MYLEAQVTLGDQDLLSFLGFLEVHQVLGFLGKKLLSEMVQAGLVMKIQANKRVLCLFIYYYHYRLIAILYNYNYLSANNITHPRQLSKIDQVYLLPGSPVGPRGPAIPAGPGGP